MSYLYRGSFENAKLSGEIEAYRESRSDNIRCKKAIEKAIADNFDGFYLNDQGVKRVIADFGYDRTMWVLAASILNGLQSPQMTVMSMHKIFSTIWSIMKTL